jgi:hypothetical protein
VFELLRRLVGNIVPGRNSGPDTPGGLAAHVAMSLAYQSLAVDAGRANGSHGGALAATGQAQEVCWNDGILQQDGVGVDVGTFLQGRVPQVSIRYMIYVCCVLCAVCCVLC